MASSIFVLFPIIAILGSGLWLRALSGKPLALTIPVALSLIIAAMFLGSLVGEMDLFRWALLVIGIAGFLIEAVRTRQGIEFPVVSWILALAALAVLNGSLNLIFWDEFSHWATFPRFLIETGEMPKRLGDIIFLEYPPGWGLFAFFLLRGAGFSEGGTLFAASMLQATLMLPLLAGLQWRQMPINAAIVLGLSVFPAAFGLAFYGWTAIAIDNATPLAAAAGLATYLFAGRDRVSISLAAPLLTMAVLLKGSGAPMAAAIGLSMLLDQAWMTRSLALRPRVLSLLRTLWPAAGMPLLAMLLWSLHVKYIDQTPIWDTSWETVSARVVDLEFSAYASGITRDFFAALRGHMAFSRLNLTLLSWIVAFASLAAAALWVRPQSSATVISVQASLVVGFIVYAGLLLAYFLIAFVPYEAVRLASMERYISSYLQLWLLCSFTLLLASTYAPGARRALGAILVSAYSVAFIAGLGPEGVKAAFSNPRRSELAQGTSAGRSIVSEATRWVRAATGERSSVYILANGSVGLEYYASMFELKPRRTSTPAFLSMSGIQRMHDPYLWCHSLGPKRFDGDIWSCPWTSERLAEDLKGWDYLLIYSIDQPFIDTFGKLFEGKMTPAPFGLYRIDTSSGLLHLVPSGDKPL